MNRDALPPVRQRLFAGLRSRRKLRRDMKRLADSGLFDLEWYRASHPDIPAMRALEHFAEIGWRSGESPGPGFDSLFYLRNNPDVAEAGINPVIHYIRHGKAEHRLATPPLGYGAAPLAARSVPGISPPLPPFSIERMRLAVRHFQSDAPAARNAIRAGMRSWHPPALRPGSAVTVFVHSRGNIFMREIAELLAAGFDAAGFPARLADEEEALRRQGSARPEGEIEVVVAPHEFFSLPAQDRHVPLDWGKGIVMLNVEQLHTSWFHVGLNALRQAAMVLDISLPSAATLAEHDLPAAYLPLGHVPGFPRLALQPTLPDMPALATLEPGIKRSCPPAEAPLSERPIDIFFIGYLSPRRSEILGRMAERLARWRCHFVLTDGSEPQVSGRNAVLESEATIGLAQRSKIVLNLHQSEETFFEWHRIVLQGIWHRTLVISEPVSAQDSFTPGEHFLEAQVDELADVIDWVLGTEAGARRAEQIRNAGFEQLSRNVGLAAELHRLFSSAEEAM